MDDWKGILTELVHQLQGPTPPPSTPWWQITQDKVPYVVILIVAVVATIVGGLIRPLVENLGNAFLQKLKGIGKHGKFRKRYLTEIISRSRHLRLLPSVVVTSRWDKKYHRRFVELEELYTPLSLGEERGELDPDEIHQINRRQTHRGKKQPKNWLQSTWWKIRPPVDPSAGELGEIIQSHPRLIVRGDPGSGKTTLLRYLAITSARSLRNDRSDGDNAKMTRLRLGWHKQRFPLIVNLGGFADVVNWPKGKRLLEAVVARLPGELRTRYPNDFFEKQLEKGRCLVMFDGFDELGSRTARNRMARLIDDLANTYNHPENRFIVSTRIVGYEGQLDATGFAIRTVQDLDSDAVHDLVKRRYKAIAIGEGLGRSEQERKDLAREYTERADSLLTELQHNEGLQRLITNPLLLSLIVLVSLVQVRLPEQRHLLYRDCVEVLTERWQLFRQETAGADRHTIERSDDLTLDQKLTLLRRLALTLQTRREQGASQVLMPRSEARQIIANMLPDFIPAHLPEEKAQQKQECGLRAAELLDTIRAESGILVEKGLDERTGEPVVGFSHLTFQEYLAADAIHHQNDKLPLLLENLFNPAWREVLLLYVSLEDGEPVINACLETASEPFFNRYLLAGRCLAEDGLLDARLRRRVLYGLQCYFCPEGQELRRAQVLFDWFGSRQRYDWLMVNFMSLLTNAEHNTFAISPETAGSQIFHPQMQQTLLRLLTEADDFNVRYQAGCVLSAIGDPRDFDEMILIPAGEFGMGSEKGGENEKPVHRLHLDDYEISKYPVTNAQYHRFVQAANYQSPRHWGGDAPAPWMANHPVAYVNWYDAVAYCKWLSEETGKQFQLPSEVEWEKAARGIDDQREYPWGDEFDPRKANTAEERGDWQITPVGMYPLGASPYGVLDLSGNLWEWTRSLYHTLHFRFGTTTWDTVRKIFNKKQTDLEFNYPYDHLDGRENQNAAEDISRILRGGSWFYDSSSVRLSRRLYDHPFIDWINYGFRVVALPSGRS